MILHLPLRRMFFGGLLALVPTACGQTYIDQVDDRMRDAGSLQDGGATEGGATDARVVEAGCTLLAAPANGQCTAGLAGLTADESILWLPLASSKIAVTDSYIFAAVTGVVAGAGPAQPSRLMRFPKTLLKSGSAAFAECSGDVVLTFEGNAATELLDIKPLTNDGVCILRSPASTGVTDLACLDGGDKAFRTRAQLSGTYVADANAPNAIAAFDGRIYWSAKWPRLAASPPPPSGKADSEVIFSYGTGAPARVEQTWTVVNGACGIHFNATAHASVAKLIATGVGLAALGESTDSGGRVTDDTGHTTNCEGRSVRTFAAREATGNSNFSYTYENNYTSLAMRDFAMNDSVNLVYSLLVTPDNELAFAQAGEGGDVDSVAGYLVTNRAYRSRVSAAGAVLALPSGLPGADGAFPFTQQVGTTTKLRAITLVHQSGSVAAAWANSPVSSDRVFTAGTSHALVSASTGLYLAVVADQNNGCNAQTGYIARTAR